MKIDKSLLGYVGMGITFFSIIFMNDYLILVVVLGIALIFYGFNHK